MKAVANAVFNQQWQKKHEPRREDRRDDSYRRAGSYDREPAGSFDGRHKKSTHTDGRHGCAPPAPGSRNHYDEPLSG
jgi:hypothetical protein